MSDRVTDGRRPELTRYPCVGAWVRLKLCLVVVGGIALAGGIDAAAQEPGSGGVLKASWIPPRTLSGSPSHSMVV